VRCCMCGVVGADAELGLAWANAGVKGNVHLRARRCEKGAADARIWKAGCVRRRAILPQKWMRRCEPRHRRCGNAWAVLKMKVSEIFLILDLGLGDFGEEFFNTTCGKCS